MQLVPQTKHRASAVGPAPGEFLAGSSQMLRDPREKHRAKEGALASAQITLPQVNVVFRGIAFEAGFFCWTRPKTRN